MEEEILPIMDLIHHIFMIKEPPNTISSDILNSHFFNLLIHFIETQLPYQAP